MIGDPSNNIPDDYICPLTQDIMNNPVMAADGHSYEQSAILEWLKNGNIVSPQTGEKLQNITLIQNIHLKTLINTFKSRTSQIQLVENVEIDRLDSEMSDSVSNLWDRDKKSGQKKMTFASGNIYEGGWEFDQRQGQGQLTFASGSIYEGQWDKDKKHGYGRYTFVNEDIYEGQWVYGKRHGKGSYTFKTGEIYEGDWDSDKKHGLGKQTYKMGETYDGQWYNDKRHGQGKYTFASGDIYEGSWKNGSKH